MHDSDLDTLIADTERVGWEEALFLYYRRQVARGIHSFENERSADWIYFLPNSPERRTLSLGIGLGAVPITLTTVSSHVDAVDCCRARTEFLRLRARQQAIETITAYHCDDYRSGGLVDGSYDLVATAPSHMAGPALPDFDMLAHRAWSLLGPGGVAQFLVDNSWGIQHLFRRERASGGAALHSRHGYETVLRRTGFDSIQTFAVLPLHNRVPMFYVPLESRGAMDFFFDSLFPLFMRVDPAVKQAHALEYALARRGVWLANRLHLTRLAPRFFSGFLLLATKGE